MIGVAARLRTRAPQNLRNVQVDRAAGPQVSEPHQPPLRDAPAVRAALIACVGVLAFSWLALLECSTISVR